MKNSPRPQIHVTFETSLPSPPSPTPTFHPPLPPLLNTTSATSLIASQYHEMRWRILSLAADLDRIQRAEGGPAALTAPTQDPRLTELLSALEILLSPHPHPTRAEQVQQLLSDHTPPPPR